VVGRGTGTIFDGEGRILRHWCTTGVYWTPTVRQSLPQ
jgi:hypothetical protein